MQRASLPTFAGGEISAAVAARYDIAKYNTALLKARNVFGLVTGGQYNRPGMEFCDYTAANAYRSELFDFSYSDEQGYCLEFTQEVMRVFYDGSPVVEPALLITAATATNPLTVTVPDSGWVVGDRIYFDGVEGMTQINLRTLRVSAVAGDVLTFDIDASTWSAFTGSGGGVPGDVDGGTGGYPPPTDPLPPAPDYPVTDPVPPVTRPPGIYRDND